MAGVTTSEKERRKRRESQVRRKEADKCREVGRGCVWGVGGHNTEKEQAERKEDRQLMGTEPR